MTQDFSNYTAGYYQRDQTFARYDVLRPDQLAALCYALDWSLWMDNGNAGPGRDPGLVVSIGAGRGQLERAFERLGINVIGVDPSDGAHELYVGTELVRSWTPELIASAGTIVFCESIEHVPIDETRRLLRHVRSGTRVIIVNFVDFHPIIPQEDDGWDHITRVDDALFAELADGHDVVAQRGSHLVFDVVH